MNLQTAAIAVYLVGSFLVGVFLLIIFELERRNFFEPNVVPLMNDGKKDWAGALGIFFGMVVFWPGVLSLWALAHVLPFFHRQTIGRAADVAERVIDKYQPPQPEEFLLRATYHEDKSA